MHLATHVVSRVKALTRPTPSDSAAHARELTSVERDLQRAPDELGLGRQLHLGQWRAWVLPTLSVALFVLALWIVHRELATLHLREVLRDIRVIPTRDVIAALALTATSYGLLGLYDVLALHYIGKRVPYPRAAFVSFIAFAMGHNLSLAGVTGTAVRYRLYGSAGLNGSDVALLSGFVSMTGVAGLALVAGAALMAHASVFAPLLHLAPVPAQVVGAALLSCIAAYATWAVLGSRVLSIRRWIVAPPSLPVLLLQLTLGVVELTVAAGVLWTLLPSDVYVSFPAFVGVYTLAVIASLVSNVPAGLGVFEAVILVGLSQARPGGLLASLFVYRAIYYLVPLFVAALLFAVKQLQAERSKVALFARASSAYIAPVVPQLASVVTFVAGATLLMSGFAPRIDAGLGMLERALPLPVLELSHLTSSIAGLALLILSRSLMKRVTAARHIAMWLLSAGVIAALLHGPHVVALILATVFVILWLGQSAFNRPASILEDRFTPAWIASIAVVLIATIWLGLFAHRHVEYANNLWWSFAVDGDAPRVLRASLVLVLFAGAYFTTNLLRPSPPPPYSATSSDLVRVQQVLLQEDHTVSQLALAGDKRLLFADAQDAFLMYQVCGRSWIALGDPVGCSKRDEELAWKFRELCDRHAGLPVFYQVRAERLPLYIDLGLNAFKLGEEARVPLAEFDLTSSARATLRHAHRRGERDGLTFEIAPRGAVIEYLDELQRISNAWLTTKNTAEKHFSVGAFSADYLANFPIAMIRRAGSLVAFANLWVSETREEISVDLMRFGSEAPNGTMDYLFTELFVWGRQQGYRWFNLGMAPLSGLGSHRLASRWHHVGALVFRHGEHFYNFRGLRRYKEKFAPVWEPRYLVAPGGLSLPRVIMDISLLISGGVRGLLTR